MTQEQIEAIIYKHSFDELQDDKYVFLRKNIRDIANEIALSMGKEVKRVKGVSEISEAEEDEPAECMGCGYPLSCANPNCEYDKGAVKYASQYAQTGGAAEVDWDKVRGMLVSIAMDRVGVDDVLNHLKHHLPAAGRE